MNKHCYRMVFNKARGILMAVAEIAVSHGKASGETSGKTVVSGTVCGSALRALTLSAWATLAVNTAGLIMWPAMVQAQIVADPNAPANQRPTILAAPNGVPLVNIQTPSGAGVSRNTYRQFDVQQQGAILNNSRTNACTQLGGWVQANPWLATGSARVILNEVNSSNPSLLQGYVEVAGSRAQVVIANPAGVTCDGCGFINSNRATLTTGTPIFAGGNLEGYRVQGGVIKITGAGLDASTADYTDLIARAVQVNAGIWANQLTVATGANQVDADHTVATPIVGTGAVPAFAIDVAQLGGMYAGKILLVGTEAGVGVRNAGNIGASIGEVIVTAEGRLENAGRITSASHMQIDTSGGIQNSGTIVSIGRATLNTTGDLDNQGGQIQAVGEANINLSGTLNNTASLMRAGQALSITAGDIVNVSTQGDNQGLEGLSVSLNAQQIDNQQGAVRADDALVVTSGNSIDNTQGVISSGKSVRLQDAILADKTLTITNTGGTVIAGQQLNVDSASLTGDGKVLSLGDLSLELTQNYIHSGELQANGRASLETAGTLANQSTLLAGTALNLKAASIDNQVSGQISANQVALQATDNQTLTNRGLIEGQDTIIEATTLNNLGAGRIYGDHIAIGATTVINDAENGVAPVIGARNRLDIGAQTITNREHALLFSAGDLAIGGSLDINNQATGQAATLNNNSATIEALGSVDLAVRQINNTNEHFSTTVQSLGTEHIVEYQGSGSPNRYTPGTPGVYIYNDESDQLHTPEGNYESWLSYNYNRSVTETKVQSSDPAQILSGTDLRISADTLLNDKSEIIAGGELTGAIATLNNTEVAGRRTISDSGTVTSYWRDNEKGRDSTGSSIAGYNPATVIQAISLTPTVYRQNTAPAGTGTQIATLYPGSTSQAPSGAHAVSVPNNSLFILNSSPTLGYLVETDARFANYRNWLSSDYLLNALSMDPATTQKRLGDGFYEQKLIREQVVQLTGRRFLDGYANDEAQYQALMGNASTFAQAYHLRPGVALSAEQMAQLTSDIVWLVEKEVLLPNGQTTKALVPQLYVAVKDGDLQASGALIAGNNVNLNLSSDLNNSGTIAGRNVVALTAENVRNLGGRITGNDVGVAASNDLSNIGGTIDAANSLTATAGRDLNVISTTSTQTNAQGSRTNINRVAGLYVTGSSGTLLAAAGRDVNFDSATILNAAPPGTEQPAGTTMIVAGNNLNLGTVTESSRNSIVWDGKNYRKESSRTDVGTTIQTQGEIRLQAGNDLNAKAANVSSDQGTLLATAGGNVNLIAGEVTRSLDEAHQHTSKGFLSSKTITTRDTLSETTAQASTLSGNATTVLANQDINVKGSNVVGTNDVTLTALNNVKIESATNTLQESHFREEKKSGLLSSGGIGFTIGNQQQSTDNKGVSAMAVASTVGSTAGNVTIAAGNDYRQVGSNVVAPQGDIDINAQKIDIVEAQNTSRTTTETRFKQSGITLALSSPVISAVQTAQHMAEAAGDTKDARMQALAGATVALNAKSAYDAVKAGQAVKDGNLADKVGGVSVSISVGSSKSQSNSTQTSSTAQGSTVAAGNNVNLTAIGAGKDSEITVQGSQVTAGSNVTLKADDAINLLAAKSTAEQHSTNKSSSGSLGVSFGSQTGVTLAASQGRGNADGSDVSYSNTHIEAGNTLALQSGGDTTLKGAVASGKQVVADVGGNLNIESLQDTSSYESKQKSISGSVTLGASPSGSVSASKSKVDSNYASVIEQSGIKAGDDGFQVEVAGNTDLKGAVIASTQAAVDQGLNRFQTDGTLTTSDIQNQASYSAKSVGANIGAGVSLDGKLAPSGSGAGMGKDSGDASSTTQAGISGIAGNTAVRTGDAETGIAKIFDADKVQREINAQVQITQAFSQQASQAVESYVQNNRKALQEQLKQAGTEEDKAAIQEKIRELNNEERVMNVLIGAVTGMGGTIVLKESLSLGAEKMRDYTIEDSQKFKGVADGDFVLSNFLKGKSEGVRGDNFGTGGTRNGLDSLCGTDNRRCMTKEDENGNKMLDLKDGMVQWDKEGADGMSLVKWLETDEGKKMAGVTGGIQGWTGTLFGKPYVAGSWQDKLVEAFGGTHDVIGGTVSGLYDEQGNARRGRSDVEKLAQEAWSVAAIVPSAPFAMAELLPPEVWKGVSIFLGAAK